jgi:hypothetical protein
MQHHERRAAANLPIGDIDSVGSDDLGAALGGYV